MKMIFRATKPNSIEMALTMTMTLNEWQEFQKQLMDKYPSWQVAGAITDMTLAAQQAFESSKESD